MADLFGIDREQKIKKSKVREVFTPHRPVNSVLLFLGRADEVQAIIAQINTPGQHALLYGDRGVGKSSLANIAAQLLFDGHILRGKLLVKRCDSLTTFEGILEGPLKAIGVDLGVGKTVESHAQGGGAKIGAGFAGANIKSDRTTTKESQGLVGKITPSRACELLKDVEGVLVIDELDAIREDRERWKIAEFIKLLSDENAQLKLLLVGIARTAAQLTSAHPSVGRCLKETQLQKMRDDELEGIVVRGARKLGLLFDVDVTKIIVRLSSGYPHFTHLLALKCAENSVAEGRNAITKADLARALLDAVKDAEGTLLRKYEQAVRSHSTDMYRHTLCAAASITTNEFSAEALRQAILARTGRTITQGALNNFLKKLVSDDDETVLQRRAKGVYAFADPRMPSFIRIANQMM